MKEVFKMWIQARELRRLHEYYIKERSDYAGIDCNGDNKLKRALIEKLATIDRHILDIEDRLKSLYTPKTTEK